MQPIVFVATLFLLSVACLVVAIADGKVGWLLGSAVAFAVGVQALRLRNREVGRPAPPRGLFFVVAMLVMLAAMAFLFWLQTFA